MCKNRRTPHLVEDRLGTANSQPSDPELFSFTALIGYAKHKHSLLDWRRFSQNSLVETRMNHLCVVLVLSAVLTLLSRGAAAHESGFGSRAFRSEIGAAEMQAITDQLRTRLEILERVDVIVVANNPLVMSVETRSGRSGPFIISVDKEFAASLTEEELPAALAHELGHVWIYTHHPYLQTEKLANDIAMRVVTRATLEPVYEKVWKRTGIKGNLAEFIGQAP